MTALSSIPDHTLYIECRCGHSAPLRVRDLIRTRGGQLTVKEVVDRARCSACGAGIGLSYRIIYVPDVANPLAGGYGQVRRED